MFVKATKAKGYTYVNIVEFYRDETGVSRHKILYNFDRLDELKADKSFVICIRKLCRSVEIPLLEDREEELTSAECSEAEMLNYGYFATSCNVIDTIKPSSIWSGFYCVYRRKALFSTAFLFY